MSAFFEDKYTGLGSYIKCYMFIFVENFKSNFS